MRNRTYGSNYYSADGEWQDGDHEEPSRKAAEENAVNWLNKNPEGFAVIVETREIGQVRLIVKKESL